MSASESRFQALGDAIFRRSSRAAERDRDPLADTAPLLGAALVAWWTTVRSSGFSYAGTAPAKVAAVLALVGVAASSVAVYRRHRFAYAFVLVGFIVPAAAAWLLGPQGATALLDPMEIFVGGLAWALFGVVVIRPQAVAVPRGSEGGRGPSIGTTDDAARVMMRALDDQLADPKAKFVLSPRKPTPRWASFPALVGALACTAVAYQVSRVGTNFVDRAILARTVGAGSMLVLLATAGDLVEARYTARKRSPPRSRMQRAGLAIATAIVVGAVGYVTILRDAQAP